MEKTKTTIYLVRHGQTEWNVMHKFQGHQDSPLTELGMNQARWLGEAISNEQIDTIYSSSSIRARRTAEIIRGNREIEIIQSDEFKEINLGVWEGMTQVEAKNMFPNEHQYFWNDPERFVVPGSETFIEVSERSLNKLNQIISEHHGKSILIVTHTVVVKLIMAYFEERPIKEIWNPPYIHPACLCKVELEKNKVNIILHGDIKHYKENPIVS